MTTFILSETPSRTLKGKVYKGRLIFDEISHGTQIEAVEADPITAKAKDKDGNEITVIVKSAWQIAREKINELKYVHVQNAGWFVPEVKKVKA